MFLRLRGCGELHQDTEDSARRVNIPISAHLDPTTMSDIAPLEFYCCRWPHFSHTSPSVVPSVPSQTKLLEACTTDGLKSSLPRSTLILPTRAR
ncbi:hypothetical protein Hypma_003363 [Hypsizygus marmoreus]|uniref:Uncharacterized protein n=1 Tax=Hypsizygus marmoreus TaxID=39966 RepID=A0A369J8S0_HYPMA|nr:hypothetical protein Hypma_003363 [Hypsizygus marmoreus]